MGVFTMCPICGSDWCGGGWCLIELTKKLRNHVAHSEKCGDGACVCGLDDLLKELKELIR